MLVSKWHWFAALLIGSIACGEDSPDVNQPRSKLIVETLKESADGQRQVASVNGVPIFERCVKSQARAGNLSRQDALQECIDFELLSQQAGGYLQDTSVQQKAKQELVRAYISKRYPIQSADSIPMNTVKKLWDIVPVRRRFQHPELRNIVFCRIPLPKGADRNSKKSQEAEQFLRGIYESMKNEKDLKKNDLFGACHPHYKAAGIAKLKLHTTKVAPRSGYSKAFRATIFDGPERAGMVLPPLLTQFGWDLILLIDVRAEKNISFAEAEPELREALFTNPVYESWRASLFADWSAPFAASIQINKFPENIPTNTDVLGSHIPSSR